MREASLGLRYRSPMLALLVLPFMVWSVGCGPNHDDPTDAWVGNHNWVPPDAAEPDAEQPDAQVVDASDPCVPVPEGRTGTTIRALDNLGEDQLDPIEPGTVLTVTVELSVDTAPEPEVGYLRLRPSNLSIDASSFLQDGNPLTVPSPFANRIPLTLAQGTTEITFEATVGDTSSTIEVDAWLTFGEAGGCEFPQSHSLAVLQVLGGESKGDVCYDLDEARSVQVTPAVPKQSTAAYQTANGYYDAVLIDNLVVGTQCPGPGVLVHQISKCFTRSNGSEVSLSGAAYGGEAWNVDDIFLIEVLDENEEVVAAYTTFQVTNQTYGCCSAPPCTSVLAYDQGGPLTDIENTVQGGGDNGVIDAGEFVLTSFLPNDGAPFYLRFTALDQGIEGLLSRVFLNLE